MARLHDPTVVCVVELSFFHGILRATGVLAITQEASRIRRREHPLDLVFQVDVIRLPCRLAFRVQACPLGALRTELIVDITVIAAHRKQVVAFRAEISQ